MPCPMPIYHFLRCKWVERGHPFQVGHARWNLRDETMVVQIILCQGYAGQKGRNSCLEQLSPFLCICITHRDYSKRLICHVADGRRHRVDVIPNTPISQGIDPRIEPKAFIGAEILFVIFQVALVNLGRNLYAILHLVTIGSIGKSLNSMLPSKKPDAIPGQCLSLAHTPPTVEADSKIIT